ncbi:MAG: ADP-ribosylglycohydrolase family protein [Bdellovibrionaceae bacterium]|nr:ADP-ribosylglycohydrolase family protein [Pseudobdellovibrionaceae bacterium]
MLGAIAGDIIGSRFKFKNCTSKDFELFADDSVFTDNTVCTVSILDTLFNKKDETKNLLDWCRRYPDLNYDRNFKKWINSQNPLPYQSVGNGEAARVSAVGWFANTIREYRELCDRVTKITHYHSAERTGAQAVAYAIYTTKLGILDFQWIRERIECVCRYDLAKSVDQLREEHKFNETYHGTIVPQALICCLNATDFEDAIRNAISIGGDSSAIAAITGSIAEAKWGVPNSIRDEVWSRLPEDIKEVLSLVYLPEKWTR